MQIRETWVRWPEHSCHTSYRVFSVPLHPARRLASVSTQCSLTLVILSGFREMTSCCSLRKEQRTYLLCDTWHTYFPLMFSRKWKERKTRNRMSPQPDRFLFVETRSSKEHRSAWSLARFPWVFPKHCSLPPWLSPWPLYHGRQGLYFSSLLSIFAELDMNHPSDRFFLPLCRSSIFQWKKKKKRLSVV